MRVEKKQEQQNQQFEKNYYHENNHRLQDMPRQPANEPFYWNKKPGQKPLSTN